MGILYRIHIIMQYNGLAEAEDEERRAREEPAALGHSAREVGDACSRKTKGVPRKGGLNIGQPQGLNM